MDEKQQKLDALAREVLTLSRNTLLVNLRFLDAALSMFEFVPVGESTLMTDGSHLLYNARHVLERYKAEKEGPVRDYLHIVMHCVFRHMFMDPTLDRPVWDLACDVAVENMITELDLRSVEAVRQSAQQKELDKLKSAVGTLTAEKLYNHFKTSGASPADLARLRGLFYADDHEPWYMTDEQLAAVFGIGGTSSDGDGQNGANETEESGDETDEAARSARAALADRWQEISERMQMEMETFAKQQGDQAGSMMQNLREVNREKYDYTAFLKKFAVMGEVMKINDDEFDYVYYTYGLTLYKNLPLIEPLEYKDVKRIREFVIAIDTSGSVAGEQVQTFLQKTYNILLSTESFFSRINLHIVQCDAEVQEHVKITSRQEFDDYLKTMQIRGLGGTDFRPVFSLVNKLVEEKEFTNLKGLIYFTDGYGCFPAQKPGYNAAFVFIQDEYNNYDVPPWAIKLILRKDEI